MDEELRAVEEGGKSPEDWQDSSAAPFYELWFRAVGQPVEETYRAIADDPASSVGRAALWVALAGLVAYAITSIGEILQRGSELAQLAETSPVAATAGGVVLLFICAGPLAAVASVGVLMLHTGILQFVAGALGGSGDFRRLFTSMSAFWAPVTLVTGALNVVPYVGPCLTIPISLYALFLSALAVKAINQFGWGEAIATLLIPLIVFVLLGVIIFFLLFFPALQTFLEAGPGGF